MANIDNSGKLIIVTGGAGGIGKVIVQQLLAKGFSVLSLDINIKGLDDLTALTGNNSRLQILECNIGNWAETKSKLEPLLSASEQAGVNMYGLVNCAATSVHQAFEDITEAALDKVYSINVKAAINLSQIVVERLKKHKCPGSIVNIGSVLGQIKVPELICTNYAVSKAAISHLTKCMASELGPHGIRVNCVQPDLVDTPFTSVIIPEKKALIRARAPLNRKIEPENVASAVVFLLSEDAAAISGIDLVVDAGRLTQ